MPSDIEMEDSDSSVTPVEVVLDPAIAATVVPAPERVVHKCREYLRRPGLCAAETPSVIWSCGEEFERNKKKSKS